MAKTEALKVPEAIINLKSYTNPVTGLVMPNAFWLVRSYHYAVNLSIDILTELYFNSASQSKAPVESRTFSCSVTDAAWNTYFSPAAMTGVGKNPMVNINAYLTSLP